MIHKELSSKGEITIIQYKQDDEAAYEKTNIEILNKAEALSQAMAPAYKSKNKYILALVVWDGRHRERQDATAHFLKEAKNRNIKIKEIITL